MMRPNCTRSLAKATRAVEHVLRRAQRVGRQHHPSRIQHALRRRDLSLPRPTALRRARRRMRGRSPAACDPGCGASAATRRMRRLPRRAALPSRRNTSRCVGAPASIDAGDAAGQPIVLQRRVGSAGLSGEDRRSHAEARLARGDARQEFVLLRFGRAMDERQRRHDRLPVNGTGAAAAPSASAATAASSTPRPAPPNRSGTSRPCSAEFAQALPQLFIEAVAGSASARSRSIGSRSVRKPAQRIVEQALLLAEGEFHQPLPIAPRSAAFGSRGRSRPRSPMMFFWMLFEPPPIISPTSYM